MEERDNRVGIHDRGEEKKYEEKQVVFKKVCGSRDQSQHDCHAGIHSGILDDGLCGRGRGT